MHASQFHYLPLAPGFFSALVLILVVLFILVQVGVLRYAYMRLGLTSGSAFLLLIASLAGSYFNIPIAELPGQRVVPAEVVDFFGMRYQVPVLVNWPGTVIAVNIGGAVIPALMSIYLLVRYELWFRALMAITVVAAIVYWYAQPIPGLGIAVPIFAPAAATAIAALVLARERAPPLAYIAGSMGTLVGADLLNLGKITSMGSSIASIGGAGTFDGIFLTGIVAVLLASFTIPFSGKASPP